MSLYLYTQIVRSLGIEEPDSPPTLGRVFEGLASWFDVMRIGRSLGRSASGTKPGSADPQT